MDLIGKHIDVEQLETLYEFDFTQESMDRDMDIRGGQWYLENGTLIGKNPGNCPGMIISKQDYFGPVMLDFEARTVLPCTHDVNWMWSGSWNYETNTRALAYVAGLQGWWTGKMGFEKSPEYAFNCATQIFPFEPGRYYHIQSGSIGGHVFCMIDGKLVLELTDPDPIDQQKYGKVGFEAYCSQLQIRRFSIRRAAFTPDIRTYQPEF